MSVYIIAEAGVNHNGSVESAKQLIDIASESGADAVKFQTFRTSELLIPDTKKAPYQSNRTSSSETQFEMIQKYELSFEAFQYLCDYSKIRDIDFLSTPFDVPSLDFLVSGLDLRTIKIPSGEITNIPFLLDISRKAESILLSTGMSSLGEIEMALSVLAYGFLNPSTSIPNSQDLENVYSSSIGHQTVKERVTLLHCTTEYPAPFDSVNLRAIHTLRSAFGLPVGYSDHTEGINIPIAAVALGSTVIEKHFTLDKSLPGPDHSASLDPSELRAMCNSIRQIELSLGTGLKFPTCVEHKNKLAIRKSIVASQPIKEGDIFTLDNLTCKRPGNGIPPAMLWSLLGTRSTKAYRSNELIDS